MANRIKRKENKTYGEKSEETWRKISWVRKADIHYRKNYRKGPTHQTFKD